MAHTRHPLSTTLLALLVAAPSIGFAQLEPLPTRGKTFWCGFMQNAYSALQLKVTIASQTATSGTIDMPAQAWTQAFTVAANGTTTVIVPIGAEHIGSEIVTNKGIRITANDSVTVSAASIQSFTTDGTQVLPVEALTSTYRVEAYRGLPGFQDFYKSELLIVATQDGTEVSITPSVSTAGGHPVGIPFTVQLNAGQTYQVQGALAALDLTGTTVIGTSQNGTCRPFAVFGGSMCANVPGAQNCPACDHLFEQMVPSDKWGKRFHTVPLQGVTEYSYRVLADQNNTQVNVNGSVVATLNAGQAYEASNLTQGVCIIADRPVSVVEIMEGFSCAGAGDPSMIELIPDERTSRRVVFAPLTSQQITQHAISVITPTGNIAQMLLDGSPITAALFNTYASCPGLSVAKLTVTNTNHQLSSTAGFLAYSYGTGTGESYGYSLSSVALPYSTVDSIMCVTGPITLTSPVPVTNAVWTVASDPGTTLATGSSYTFTPTQNDVWILDGETPLSGCPVHHEWQIGIPAPPTILLTANGLPALNICQYSAVQLNTVPAPDPAVFDLTWTPAAQLSDANIPNPVAYPMTDTWYKLEVSSPLGCGSATDSILVQVTPNDLYGVTATVNDSAICLGGSVQLSAKAERVIASELFELGGGPMWTSIQGGSLSNVCGSGGGNALYFNGGPVREAISVPFNLSVGGAVHFALKVATAASPCDDAEPGDNIVLEYSTGGPWVLLATLNEASYPAFAAVDVVLPAAAWSTTTRFRWKQPVNGGAGQDNWAMDNVLITRYDNAGVSFNWTPSNTVATPNSPNSTATPLVSTWYHISAQGGGSCTFHDSVFVLVAAAFNLSLNNDTTVCTQTALPLQAVPSSGSGIMYSWLPNNGTLSSTTIANPIANPVNTTTYTVTATTNIGCTDNENVTITVGHMNNLVVSANDQQLCSGQNTQLTAVVTCPNPYTIQWTPNNGSLSNTTITTPIATPTATTTYTAAATETSTGCFRTANITIQVSGPYTVNASPNDTLCTTLGYQLNVQHNVASPFDIVWSNAAFLNDATIASPTIMEDTTAMYVVTVTDANGCQGTDSVFIVSAFDNLLTPINLSDCAGQSLLLDAGYPGSTYEWNTNAVTQTITVSSGTQYVVQITDAMGCVTWKNFFTDFNAMPLVDLGADVELCGATSYVLDANSPGNTVLWSTSAQTQQITVATSGPYSVIVTSPEQCQATDTVNVTFHDLPTDDLQNITACITSPPVLNAGNPGCTYDWSTNESTQTITADQSTTYTVTITTPDQCSATYDAVVTLLSEITVNLGNDTTLCAGQSLTLDAGTPGSTYLWSTTELTQTINVTTTDLYSVAVTNGACQAADAITVTFLPSPTDVLVDQTSCIDQPVTLDAGNLGCTYLWSTNAQTRTITPTQSGTYSVTVTNSANCAATFDAEVTYVDYPVVTLGQDTVLCEGDVLEIDAGNAGAQFNWSTGATTQIINVTRPGIYSVEVNNGYCVGTDDIIATFNPRPSRMDLHEFYTCLDEEPHYVVIDAGNSGGNFDWSNGEHTQVILAGAYGWYFVDIVNQYDCALRDSAIVHEFCPASIFVPNTFTPNGDGVNDIWLPVGKNIGHYEMNIFDRWGNVMFHSEDPTIGWDGTQNGEFVKNEVYVWRMEYKFIQDTEGTEGVNQKQIGHVTVMR